jgi:predicted nucleic acid-binding protein
MAWVVDTAVLLDVFEGDPRFGLASARCLSRHLDDGLLISPVSYVEFSPACNGNERIQQEFLLQAGVHWNEPWLWHDTVKAHELWHTHIAKKRRESHAKRPVADVLIGAFSHRFQGLITRNAGDFRSLCPSLKLVIP